MSYKKVGALHFFRIGRFGGSIYLAKSKAKSHAALDVANGFLAPLFVAALALLIGG